ncbi:cation diffusion facilitator family transporter [Clostridium bornimense]|uniref:cation diffusion facilitator family transporter n=1 Tax=Clostridium bornimense TaxID=1216932 RepID=UPI001C119451|nr:cation diffusion facilitator family transporter [Clostridium bornimense]MBU5316041.1 cation diffusion facilitator family transporter [Clostridium bornimense]
MFSKFLVKTFIKDNENFKTNSKVRDKFGFLGGIVGIIVNLILFSIKFVVGIFSNSLAVTADAFNNLSDVFSSVVTIIGFKLAAKPADDDHPYGHGRIEYISALIVSVLVLLVGFSFVKSSISRIIHPVTIKFQWIPTLLILISISFKLWLSKFNGYLAKLINSSALKASSVDALSDCFTSGTVVISLILSQWISFPLDGTMGLIVAIFILYSGFQLSKETLNTLLGEKPSSELVKNIESEVLSYPNILGVHDLLIHSYGPNKCLASIHAEVPSTLSLVEVHNIIDKAENEISRKFNVHLVIHMDPINLDQKEISITKDILSDVLKSFPCVTEMTDLRLVGSGDDKNVLFNITTDDTLSKKYKSEIDLINDINKEIKLKNINFSTVITINKNK